MPYLWHGLPARGHPGASRPCHASVTKISPESVDERAMRTYGYGMCPECHEPLVAFALEGIEIDRCLSCCGTWLDTGELEMLIELAGVPTGHLTGVVQSVRTGSQSQRQCPRCQRQLYELCLEVVSALVLDHCPSGHGLWFDEGEMQTLVASFLEGEEGAVARFFGDLYRNVLPACLNGE